MEQNTTTKESRRIHSLDLTRGIIIVLSVYLSNIPYGGYENLRHGAWYNVTILDYILPAFITVFGTGMAIAYHRGVSWPKLIKRTIRLIIYGLIFNMIVQWNFNFETLRYTGVLQLYAALGIMAVLISSVAKTWKSLSLIAVLILILHGSYLLAASSGCEQGLPQPDCNPSGIIDSKVFSTDHIYHQGESGYDPEGILTIIASLANVLFGFAAGSILMKNREIGKNSWKALVLLGIVLIGGSHLVDIILPFNKKIWTPSFALLTAGTTISLLGIVHLLSDQKNKTHNNPLVYFLNAFGRNSFLIYFGKFILFSLLNHIKFPGQDLTFSQVLLNWLEGITAYPQLAYAGLIFMVWTIIALILHKKNWYLKV
ncbi:heparan-alpha-glucosaminide N-acetyltransferase domain-containing protein [Bacillus sp. ISL-37]|uniref:heparan-alpha-glucosaminide N-acetyltransferase domain-containing protein n=1 Tax=Bacillus sp. ISL-37 TaxID=2819123 RepID=UPI001BE56637|nr:heparan-alpha-glucosaminide N-acetyltransferase domain-containing protein [Bacillus sp. ISL-37]MBT2685995.1 DUF1624 domain-containing protein [Bacillus sp. ISL-37]